MRNGKYVSGSIGLIVFIFFFMAQVVNLQASDWPIYKGNIYFTGNNDEIIVKNNNLKWLFQAKSFVYNPVISDGKVYFLDLKKNLYCLDEEKGELLWIHNLAVTSKQFVPVRTTGNIKYPLIKGNSLFVSDSIAIYAINKNTGRVQWARTGMPESDFSKKSGAMIDGIYATPFISENEIYYGTRNVFMSRNILNGHMVWKNNEVKTYSGFPTFYDKYILTQSADYGRGTFDVYCLNADGGSVVWKSRVEKPVRIFSPVVYRRRVYIGSNNSIYCLSLKDGSLIWSKDYGAVITSSPSFTEKEILFTADNRKVLFINPDNGQRIKEIEIGEKTSPYFITIRDQIYVAYSVKRTIGGRERTFGNIRAIQVSDNKELWEFITPFPGAPSQPISSKGIMILPAGNYVYAIGTEYYPKIVEGGSGHYVLKDKRKSGKDVKTEPSVRKPDAPFPTRDMEISLVDENNIPIRATVEVKKRVKDKIVYSNRTIVKDPKEKLTVPDADNVELIATADGYLPRKVVINRKDKEKTITLEKIQKGKSFVIENIQFEFNQAYLKKESLDILDNAIAMLKKRSDIKLEVRGYTDTTGKAKYNKKLSERRADAVVEYMIKNGISPERLRSKGFGEADPIADNNTPEGRRKNRRTEFFIR